MSVFTSNGSSPHNGCPYCTSVIVTLAVLNGSSEDESYSVVIYNQSLS
jgi:hypothetical protein